MRLLLLFVKTSAVDDALLLNTKTRTIAASFSGQTDCEEEAPVSPLLPLLLVFLLLMTFSLTDFDFFDLRLEYAGSKRRKVLPLEDMDLIMSSKKKLYRRGIAFSTRRNRSFDSLALSNLRVNRDSQFHQKDAHQVDVKETEKLQLLETVDISCEAQLVDEGNVSVVYTLFSREGRKAAIFKPHSVSDSLNSSLKIESKLLLSSREQCYNEVAAYSFDQLTGSTHRAGVPPTFLVKFPSQMFSSLSEVGKLIEGSAQKYVTDGESCEDFGPGVFSTEDVHKIGILDLRILNCDRHTGNILFIKNEKKLVPIDHALSFPQITGNTEGTLYVKDVNFEWLSFPQAKEPFSESLLQEIEKIDINGQDKVMRKFGMSTEQRAAIVAATILLKKAAVVHGKTLYDIASIIQRAGARDEASPFESMVKQTVENVKKVKGIVDVNAFGDMFSEYLNDFLRL